MSRKLLDKFFVCISLLIVILLFTIIDHALHGLQNTWGVPDYYFRNKIPFGFLWGIVGLIAARKFRTIWLKSLIVSGVIAVTLQTRYFIEGYPLEFVLVFLLFHFLILYSLTVGMFLVSNRYSNKTYSMNKTVIALLLLVAVGIGAYYLVFANKGGMYPNPQQQAPTANQETVPAAKNAIQITNYSFSPATLTVKIGDTVTWTNQDSMGHSATADDKSFDTGVLDQGKSGTATFSKAGTYTYHCSVHPSMHGTIIVQ